MSRAERLVTTGLIFAGLLVSYYITKDFFPCLPADALEALGFPTTCTLARVDGGGASPRVRATPTLEATGAEAFSSQANVPDNWTLKVKGNQVMVDGDNVFLDGKQLGAGAEIVGAQMDLRGNYVVIVFNRDGQSWVRFQNKFVAAPDKSLGDGKATGFALGLDTHSQSPQELLVVTLDNGKRITALMTELPAGVNGLEQKIGPQMNGIQTQILQ